MSSLGPGERYPGLAFPIARAKPAPAHKWSVPGSVRSLLARMLVGVTATRLGVSPPPGPSPFRQPSGAAAADRLRGTRLRRLRPGGLVGRTPPRAFR